MQLFKHFSLYHCFLGVLPLCVCHSGIKDVLDKLEETEPELEEIMHVTVNSGGDFDAANGSHLVEVNEVCNQQIYSSV